MPEAELRVLDTVRSPFDNMHSSISFSSNMDSAVRRVFIRTDEHVLGMGNSCRGIICDRQVWEAEEVKSPGVNGDSGHLGRKLYLSGIMISASAAIARIERIRHRY